MRQHTTVFVAFLIAVGSLGTSVHAQQRQGRDDTQRRDQRLRLDQRYQHDHYYPHRGQVVPALPRASVSIGFGGGSYFFHGGVWFQPRGGRFVVVVPPRGIVAPALPPAFSTLWIGGLPYYYANDVYYMRAQGPGYVVVAPPPNAELAQPLPAPTPLPDPIIYPRNGQSAEQLEQDRQDCNRWATTQPQAMADAQVFQRATAACMDGRGYTVR